MKIRAIVVPSFLTMCLALAGPAFAQVANPGAEAQWQSFLSNHPEVSASMANNPNYLSNHPGVATWLEQHPDVAAQARQEGQVGSGYRQNQWRAQNDANFGREGAERDPSWEGEHSRRDYAGHHSRSIF